VAAVMDLGDTPPGGVPPVAAAERT
jgi:hypothetical protein